MTIRIRFFLLLAIFLPAVQICNSCATKDVKVITMCTSGSITGSPILLTTTNIDVNTCICAIEATPGQFVITILGRPNSSDCGTRIDITNNNGSVSTTFQCQQLELLKSVGVSITSGYITLYKQSNSTEDDIGYCLSLTGTKFTINCYGNDSQPPTSTTKEATSSATVISSTSKSTTKTPTTRGIISTGVTNSTLRPLVTIMSTSMSVSSYGSFMYTTRITTSGTTNHQDDNNGLTVGRKANDTNLAAIIAPIFGVICVIAVVIIIFLLCRRHIRNASRKDMEKTERNNNFSALSIHSKDGSTIGILNNTRIISVPMTDEAGYQGIIFENSTNHQNSNHSGPGSINSHMSNEQGNLARQVQINYPESVSHFETDKGDMYAVVKRKHDAADVQHLRKSIIPNSQENLYEAVERKSNQHGPSTHIQLHESVRRYKPNSTKNGFVLKTSSRSDTSGYSHKSSGLKPMALRIKEKELPNAESQGQLDPVHTHDSIDSTSLGTNKNSHIITEL